MSSEIAIKVENLSKCYQIYDQPRDRLKQFLLPRLRGQIGLPPKQYFREFWALRDVSFEVKKGETVGIIGRNGSGKSTLLQMICGTLNPTSGNIQTQSRIAALLELGSGFNPEFTGRENVYMNGAVLGLTRDEIESRFDDIAAFADIGQFIDQPVKTYSSGMMVRLAFAVAINVAPDILIIDEALAVGDAAFQRKCMRKINELSDSGVTLLFVSHDIETVRKICSQSLYLSHGAIRGIGPAKNICIEYERDLFGASKGAELKSPSSDENLLTYLESMLDPDLPASDEKMYGDGGAKILDVELTNMSGQRINVLEAGARFKITYKVRFYEKATRPVFGMKITNREGVSIFGTNTSAKTKEDFPIDKEEVVFVEFVLTNNLGPGIYYLTCGIHADSDRNGIIYLQRRMDVLIFRVLAPEGVFVGGTAQLYPVSQVKYSVAE